MERRRDQQVDSSNPFASAAPLGSNPFDSGFAVDQDRFVMTRTGPDVDPNEVEIPGSQSVEVMILWGESVLHVDHLTPST